MPRARCGWMWARGHGARPCCRPVALSCRICRRWPKAVRPPACCAPTSHAAGGWQQAFRQARQKAWHSPPPPPTTAASAVGVGARIAGQGLVSLGTSGVVFRVPDAFAPATGRAVHAFAHALPQRWHQMSVMLSAASAFGWVTRLTGQRDEARLSAAVAAMAQARQAQAPLFLPYLSGERTPHNDAAASGVFMGLRAEHEATDLAYAVMEGVCFGLMDGLNAMRLTDTGGAPATGHAAQAGNAVHASRADAAPAMALALVGGGARSNPWAQLLASGLGCALQRPQGAHAPAALGAARLAAMACGGDEAQWCQSLPAGASFVPQAAQQALLAERYARLGALYPALQSQFGKYPVNTA